MRAGLLDALLDARVYDLEQPRYAGAPTFPAHEPGFMLFLHRRHEAGLGEARTSASGLIVTAEHSGTHIDALCHQAEDGRLCDGTRVDATIQGPTGVTHLDAASIEPLRARGVLLDVPALLDDGATVPTLIGSDLLQRALEAQGLELRPGDAVLVRTGNGAHFHERARYEAGPGIAGEASAWLAAQAPLVVGSDTMAWDLPGHRDPQLDCTLPGHVHLICRAGVHIVENLALEELAADGVGEFAFLCLPLKMRGATGSPVRPVALV